MLRTLSTIATLASLAALVPAQAWQLPERGVAFYKRQRTTTGAKAGHGEVEMPALLCEGELDRSRKFVALPPADVRDLGMWLAFDLKIKGKFKRRVHTIQGMQDLEITGSATPADPEGRQTITARIAPAGGRGGTVSGTLEVERTFDSARGLVTHFTATLEGQAQGGGGRRGGDAGGALQVRDTWTLDRVERNREPAFRTRVADAIRLGREHVKRAMQQTMRRKGNPNQLRVDVNSGTLALCLLTLLKAEIDPKDPAVQAGFAELRRRKLSDTYSLGVALMAMEALYAPLNERDLLISGRIKDPVPRKPTPEDASIMREWVAQLLKNFDISQRPEYLLRFNYVEGVKRYDNSNTQYALLGLYSAHLCGVPISATTWFANANSWLQDQREEDGVKLRFTTTSHKDYEKILAKDAKEAAAAKENPQRTVAGNSGRRTVAGRSIQASGWPYVGRPNKNRGTRAPAGPSGTASMTTAGLTGVTICQAVLGQGGKGGPLLGKLDNARREGFAWMLHEFSVRTNRNHPHHFYYYLYGLERACEINHIALLGHRDWYFEGANILVGLQQKGGGKNAGRPRGRAAGAPGGGGFKGAGLPQTCMAILFLKQSAPPIPVITGR